MNIHPITTPASPSLASKHFDASFDSTESLTTSFIASAVPTLETTTVTEVALGYHRNQQYSITAMTTSTGAVAERYAYTAYGQPTICNAITSSAVGNRYNYTGRECDETLGLHHFRARWMSPLAGRFLGRDPIGYEGSPFNVYEFVSSKPLVERDPYGLYSYEYCKRRQDICILAANDEYQQCIRDGWPTPICTTSWASRHALCRADFGRCMVAKPLAVCAGTVLVVGGVALCCADSPVPGPADCVGAPIAACGLCCMKLADDPE